MTLLPSVCPRRLLPRFLSSTLLLFSALTLVGTSVRAAKHNAVATSSRGELARAVIQQMNRARTNPQGYADFLETYRPYYRGGRLLQFPGQGVIHTQEGVAALDEAINVLRHTAAVGPLAPSDALKASAALLASEQAQTGGMGHFGRDGSTPFSRMSRYGTWLQRAAENVAYGSHTAERIVVDLIVDDGEADRGHRRNILNEDFHVAGAGFGAHPRFGSVCVIDFAGQFAPR